MAMKRRDLLKTAAVAVAGVVLMPSYLRAQQKSVTDAAFPHSVASGDPGQKSVVIWTRLNPEKARENSGITWRVSKNRDLSNPVSEGSTSVKAAQDHIFKKTVTGLDAGETYYYGFSSSDAQSPTGRTRTLPEGRPEKIRLALISCSNYNAGYFNVCRAVAEEPDLHAVLHLGDYIYEYANNVYGAHPERQLEPRHECITLEDYRTRYAHYRSDPDFQALHASHPLIAVWDDHEIANDSWHGGAENHDEDKEGSFVHRAHAGRQAYFEWLPIEGRRTYRDFAFGDLAHLIMIDTRHDRRSEPLAYRDFVSQKDDRPVFDVARFEAALMDKDRRIYSKNQERWIGRTLKQAAREARWTLIGNQITFNRNSMPDFSGLDLPEILQPLGQISTLLQAYKSKAAPLSLDSWGGYERSRQTMLRRIKKSANPVVVLTGDTHLGWASSFEGKAGNLEIGTPSVTSPGLGNFAPQVAGEIMERFKKANPSYLFENIEDRGYVIVEIEESEARMEWVFMNASHRNAQKIQGPTITLPYKGKPHLES